MILPIIILILYYHPLIINSIIVTTKNGNVVIASENEYNTMSESIHLVSQKNLVKKIKEGEKEDISKMPAYSPNAKW